MLVPGSSCPGTSLLVDVIFSRTREEAEYFDQDILTSNDARVS